MIKVQCPILKKSGGPGIFFNRLLLYMESHKMIEIVNTQPDIYFSTVWLDNFPRNVPIVYRAAAAYYDTKQSKRHGLNKKIQQSIRRANYVIYQSRFGQKLCEKVLSVKAKKSSIIYNGFDLSAVDATREIEKTDKLRFVACSDWSNPAKRGIDILAAFQKANELSDNQAVLTMIGKGLDQFANKSKNIHCIGRKNVSEIISYLKEADYFIHTGFAEVCPNSVVEALSCNCFVICNNVGGTKEMITPNNGMVVECDNGFRFKRHDANLILDRSKLVHGISQVIRGRSKFVLNDIDFSMQRCASQYYEVFSSIL